jgi:segregation and condensation protein B
MEYVRGVGVAGVVRTLQERNLIDVVGRAEGLGRPLLYGTTQHFLEHFGFRSLEDLPRPETLSIVLRERIPLGLDDELSEGEDDAEGEEPPVSQQVELAGEFAADPGEPTTDAEETGDAEDAEGESDHDEDWLHEPGA